MIISKIKSNNGSGELFYVLIIPLLVLFLLTVGDGLDLREVYLNIENPMEIINFFNRNMSTIFTILTITGTLLLLIVLIKEHLYWLEYIKDYLFNVPKWFIILIHSIKLILIPQEIFVLWYLGGEVSEHFNYLIQILNYRCFYLLLALISLFIYYAAIIYMTSRFRLSC